MKRLVFIVLASVLSLAFPALSMAQKPDSTSLKALDGRLEEYFKTLEPERIEVKERECDILIESARTPEVRDYIARKVYDHYFNSPVMGDEAVAIHVTDTWFSPGKAEMRSEMELLDARIFADFNRQSLLGMQAPSLEVFDPQGDTVRIGGPARRYRVLFFYDTDCAKCKMETILLRSKLNTKDLFPNMVYPVTIGREKSIALIREAEKRDSFIGAVPQNDISVEDPRKQDLFEYGTVAKIMKVLEMPDGTITAILQGIKRIKVGNIFSYSPYITAAVTYIDDIIPQDDNSTKMIAESLKEKASAIIRSSSFAPKEAVGALKSIDNFAFLVNFIATTIELENFPEKVDLLRYDDVKVRSMKLLAALDTQTQLLKIKQEINQKVKSDIDQQQREYYLNNQLRTIQEELGMDEEEEFEKFRQRAQAKKWPKEVGEQFEKELSKLEKYNPSSPDYSIQYNYIEFMLDLPWGEMSKDNLDLKHAQKVLDADHYGLDTVKDRIIEYLAVLKLKGNMKSPILCLYGPPGVGKTSLGKSIAKALGRKYVRIALGGMHDEAELRGHRKTYVGALPGRILNGIQRAGTSNPVIVLDEIDKVGSDYKGDPSSALLEVLDPEQNVAFHDNYLDIDYDLSNVLFITTANTVSTVQSALLDRMEMINVTGYLAEEKMEIAKRYLVPKQLEEHGIGRKELRIDKAALEKIIDEYTHESGVRGLEKQIAKISRVTAKKIALDQDYPTVIKKEHLKEYLGLPTNFHDLESTAPNM